MAFATANKSECKTSETEKKDLPKPDCGMWKLVRENEDTGRKCVASKISRKWDPFPAGQIPHLAEVNTSNGNAGRAEVRKMKPAVLGVWTVQT